VTAPGRQRRTWCHGDNKLLLASQAPTHASERAQHLHFSHLTAADDDKEIATTADDHLAVNSALSMRVSSLEEKRPYFNERATNDTVEYTVDTLDTSHSVSDTQRFPHTQTEGLRSEHTQ